jgi:methionyl-tRNA formyltransferase
MGTPEFGAASLRALIQDGADICAVFTQPDKPKNRGMCLCQPPVKTVAEAHGIPVYQPVTLRDGTATEQLRALRPELLIVVAYGKILTDEFLGIPTRGGINLHASLLPKYRGCAPIQWAILNGDKVSGVSVQQIAAEVDSGDVLASMETEIGEFETSGQLFERLKKMGAALLVRTIRRMEDGTVVPVPQDVSAVSITKKLDKCMSPIDWNRSPREIVKWICGLDPWPVATIRYGGETLRVFGAAYTERHTGKAPGSIVAAGRKGLEIACGGGRTLLVTELQAPGGRRMSAGEYLRGHPPKHL